MPVNLIGIAGFVIASILDIRRFPKIEKLRAYAGYHLVRNGTGWKAPKMEKGQRANWAHKLQQAVYYFAFVMNNQPPDSPWKKQLETRYRYEVGKLLDVSRLNGKDIPSDLTIESFLAMVGDIREKAAAEKKIPSLPEPFKGIPAVARKRALRWLGQKFIQYVWNEWRRFEGIGGEPVSAGV